MARGRRRSATPCICCPAKARYENKFPRVEGYTQAIRNRISVDWKVIPELILNPLHIPPEVQMKAALLSNQGRPSSIGTRQAGKRELKSLQSRPPISGVGF